MTWFVLLVPLTLLLLGFPIFVILIASSACLLMFFMNVPYAVAHQTLFGAIDKFSLLAVPFFLFAGEVMGVGGMSKRILDWCMSIIGPLRGAQGLTTIGASTVFGAISGSAPATVAAIGRFTYPGLRDKYGQRFASGIISPTEAAGIACVYGILVTKFIQRELSWRELWNVGVNSMYLTAQIMIIVAAAGVFSWVLTVNGVPQAAVQLVRGIADSPWAVLLALN